MIDKLGIVTDNFYKFLTTLSLVAFIYCSSFDTLFLSPYNEQIIKNNIETARLGAEKGYLTGLSKDLTTLIPDTLREKNIAYFYTDLKDTSDFVFYYCTLTQDSHTKQILDSLNRINKLLAQSTFTIKTIQDSNKTLENNIIVKGWLMNIFGVISLLTFLFGLNNWYKLRTVIDK